MEAVSAPDEVLPPPPAARAPGREVVVGVFVLVGLVSALVTLFVLTDASTFRGRYTVYTVVEDAGGIRRGDPVQMRGVNIGRVQGFHITPSAVRIGLEIDGQYDIPQGSHIELVANSILGGVSAVVIAGESALTVSGGETLPGSRGRGLMDAAGALAAEAGEVLGRTQQALSRQTVANIQEGSTQLRRLLVQLNEIAGEQRAGLHDLSQSLRRSADGVERAATLPELESAIRRVDQLTVRMDGMTGTLERSATSLDSILGRIERGEGTLGRLARDESLYHNLNGAAVSLDRAATSLDQLTQDFRKNPKRYIDLSLF
ncbi:MAG: MlaD family protein [Candidatus Latescibacterota bacterium]